MNKATLVKAIAARANISQVMANSTLQATLDTIAEALTAGDNVTLVGFGTFSTSDRAERNGRNPRTGEPMKIAAKKVAKFKVGKSLAEAVK